MANIKDLTSIFERPAAQLSTSPASSSTRSGDFAWDEEFFSKGTNTYSIKSQNWYTAKPYGFKATFRNDKTIVMFLPISPNNLQITTNFATNVIPTLYGTVEEHSDVRYFDITISGTTGIAPRFVGPSIVEGKMDPGAAHDSIRRSGRSAFSPVDSYSAGGFFAKTLAIANQIKTKATELVNGATKPETGINADNSGYVAFHNLYRFLLQYKKDAAGTSGFVGKRTQHPLTFFNYKDGNRYDVAVRGFTMTRSADNPMLYNYSIQLRGYNLRGLTDNVNEDLQRRLQDLGLAGIDGSSILGDIKSLSNKAKSIIGSAVGGINQLGR